MKMSKKIACTATAFTLLVLGCSTAKPDSRRNSYRFLNTMENIMMSPCRSTTKDIPIRMRIPYLSQNTMK